MIDNRDTGKRRTATRRKFVAATAATAGGLAAAMWGPGASAVRGAPGAGTAALPGFVHGGVDETIRVGLVGCGGRGRGAAVDACNADSNVRIAALADAFPDRLESCHETLRQEVGDRLIADEDHCFTGIGCCQKLLESDIDVVLLCSPPHFRPREMTAAIWAGKHVFCEKPVGVDPPGVREVLAACELARQKGLSVVSGLCWRYDEAVNEVMKRIQDGAVGDILAIQENYLTGTLWHRGNDPSWTPLEYQLRNWLYFTWLSGDLIVEQHIHSLDKSLWLNGDQPPATCYGTGGRQVRTGPEWGNVYDHFSCCFEWASGVKAFSFARHMANCFSDTEDYVIGSAGHARVLKHEIDGRDGRWRYEGEPRSMYQIEHEHLYRSIREGRPINNGDYMCKSTMMAIMGREACYAGRRVTWDEIWNSDVRLGPASYESGDVPVDPVAMPGT
jgi:predicted dehydrogenase